jgi:hypothetical protein
LRRVGVGGRFRGVGRPTVRKTANRGSPLRVELSASVYWRDGACGQSIRQKQVQEGSLERPATCERSSHVRSPKCRARMLFQQPGPLAMPPSGNLTPASWTLLLGSIIATGRLESVVWFPSGINSFWFRFGDLRSEWRRHKLRITARKHHRV